MAKTQAQTEMPKASAKTVLGACGMPNGGCVLRMYRQVADAAAASRRWGSQRAVMAASAPLERFTSQPNAKAVPKPTVAGSCGISDWSGVGTPSQGNQVGVASRLVTSGRPSSSVAAPQRTEPA